MHITSFVESGNRQVGR